MLHRGDSIEYAWKKKEGIQNNALRLGPGTPVPGTYGTMALLQV